MTKLPESGQLGTNTVRDHFGGSGQTSWPDDYYRGQLVPDVQQFTGSGFRSNDTGARFQVVRLFIHDGFMSGATAGPSYRIEFNTNSAGPLGTPIIQAFPVDLDAAGPIAELETQICLLYTSPSPRDRQKSRMPSSA